MLRFAKKTYENETRLLYISLKDEHVSHIQVDILSGTDNELDPRDYEISHLLEHLNAQLTSSTRRDSLKIAQELESVGVRWNAFVGPQRTGYFMTGPSKRISLMIDVLLSTFYDFEIDESVFFQEKQAVIQELKRRENNAWAVLSAVHLKALFPNHPRSKSLKERIRNVGRLTVQDLLEYRRRSYLPSNTFLTIAHSGKDRGSTLAQIESFVKKVPTSPVPAPEFPRLSWRPRDFSITHVPIPGLKSSRIFISYKVPYTIFDFKEMVAVTALGFLLTSGLSSRLFDKLRRELGLIYSITAYPVLDPIDKNMSHLLIDTATFHEDTMDVVMTTINTITEFATDGITSGEYDKYINNLALMFEEHKLSLHPAKWVTDLSNYFIWNRQIYDEDTERALATNITRDTIQSVAKIIFIDSSQITVTYGGPPE